MGHLSVPIHPEMRKNLRKIYINLNKPIKTLKNACVRKRRGTCVDWREAISHNLIMKTVYCDLHIWTYKVATLK